MLIRGSKSEPVEALVEAGMEVLLAWYGDANVPQELNFTWAKVQRVTRRGGLVILDKHGVTRRVMPQRHVRETRRGETSA